MKYLITVIVLILFLATGTTGQTSQISWRTTDPTSCSNNILYINKSSPGLFIRSGGVCFEIVGGGTGDVSGPAASTDSELPLFSGVGGKTLKRSNSLSGIVLLTSGVVTALSSSGTGNVARVGSPALTTPSIATAINDTNGNELVKFTATGSAVNEITVTNSATGDPVSILATGGDTDIDLIIGGKGAGSVAIGDPGATTSYIDVLASVAPSSPTAGTGTIYVDSTSKNLAVKDDAGVVKHGVQTATCTNGVGAISDAGAVTCTTTFTNPAITAQTLTDGATINWDANSGAVATVTLEGNRTMAAPTNLKVGGTYMLSVIQDATGSRTITWNAAFKWPAATAPTLTTTATRKDLITCASFDGSTLQCNALLDVR